MFETISNLTFKEIQHELLIAAITGLFLWISVRIIIKVANFIFSLLSRTSKHVKRELLNYKRMHHAHCMTDINDIQFVSAHILSIYAALNRFAYASIFLCLGLLTFDLNGVHQVSFFIAFIYLLLSLKALPLEFGSTLSKAEHKAEFDEITKLIDKIN